MNRKLASVSKAIEFFIRKIPRIIQAIEFAKNNIHDCEGYFVTSKLVKAGKAVSDLTKADRLTMEKAKAIPPNTCILQTHHSRYLILPVYENEMSLPTSVKFQVRYIKFDHLVVS